MHKKIVAAVKPMIQGCDVQVITDKKIFYTAKIHELIQKEIAKAEKNPQLAKPSLSSIQNLALYQNLINEAKIKNAIQSLITNIKTKLSKKSEDTKPYVLAHLGTMLLPVLHILQANDGLMVLNKLTDMIINDIRKEKNAKDAVSVISNKITNILDKLDKEKAKEIYNAIPNLTEKQLNEVIYPQFKEIFKSYDIRGTVEKHELSGKTMPLQLDRTLAERIGYAIGTTSYDLPNGQVRLKPGDTFVIGYDNGLTSSELANGLAEGLRNAGIHVILIHQGSTGEIYEAVPRFGTAGGIMITRSHTEKVYNGIKIVIGRECLSSDNCNDGKSDNIAKISDTTWNRTNAGPVNKGALVDLAQISARLSKQVFKQYLIDEYRIPLKKGTLPVAINYNGGTATIYADMFDTIIPEKRLVKEFRPISDPDAIEGLPDPSQPRYMSKMLTWAKQNPGIPVLSYDLDADRVSVIEGQKTGEPKLYLGDDIAFPLADHYLRLYLPQFIEKNKDMIIENLKEQGRDIPSNIEKYIWERVNTLLVDPRCSLNVKRLVENLGGKFQPQRIGHSHVKASMNKILKTAAEDFGFKSVDEFVNKTGFKMGQIEYSLHLFITNNKGIPVDCAIRASLELIKNLDDLAAYYRKSSMNLTEHIEELKKQGIIVKTVKTPEMRSWYTAVSPTKHEFVYKVFDYLKEKYKNNKDMVFTDIKDGFTINTAKGSVMFRYSNTSPKITSVIETIGDENRSAEDNYCDLLKIVMAAYNKFGGEPIDYVENKFLKEEWIQKRVGKIEDLKE